MLTSRLFNMGLTKCPQCQCELQTCATIWYCPSCKQTQVIVDETNRHMNYNNTCQYPQRKPKQATLARIQTLAKDIFRIIRTEPSQSQINEVVEKVRFMHQNRGPNCKGYKQESAAIIFKDFEDQIRMTPHQFCDTIKVGKKSFNKMYMRYKSMLKSGYFKNTLQQSSSTKIQLYEASSQDHQLKRENMNFKYEERHESNSVDNVNADPYYFDDEGEKGKEVKVNERGATILKDFNEQEERENIKKTIEKLYEIIFPSYIMKTNKEMVKNSIVEKSLKVSRLYIESEPANCLKKFFRAPSIIYCVIKINRWKISKKSYLQAVQKNLQVKLTERMISIFKEICERIFQSKDEQEEPSDSVTSNRNESQTNTQNEIKVQ